MSTIRHSVTYFGDQQDAYGVPIVHYPYQVIATEALPPLEAIAVVVESPGGISPAALFYRPTPQAAFDEAVRVLRNKHTGLKESIGP